MEVAERRSFSEAADVLNFTQSAISQQIATLERQAGIQLLNRKPVSLTEAGRLLVARAEKAIVHLRAAEAEVESLRGLRDGSLRLGTFAAAPAKLVPLAVADFSRRYPEITVTVAPYQVGESEAFLRSGKLDLALTFDHSVSPAPVDEMLVRTVLMKEPLFVAMAPGHRLARSRSVRLVEVAGEPWVTSTRAGLDLGHLTDPAGETDFVPRVTLEQGDFDTVLSLVTAGVGLAVVPRNAVRGHGQVVFRPIDGEPLTRSLYAVSLATVYPPPTVRAMLPLLKAATAAVGSGNVMQLAA